jgi:hypothetical protein
VKLKSPLLEAVGREQLKRQQAGKGSAEVTVVVCELWRLAVALRVVCISGQ